MLTVLRLQNICPASFLLLFSWSVSMVTACPPVCSCDSVIIDCAGKGFKSLPVIHSFSKPAILNISSNNLTVLQTVTNELPAHSILDLSNNQISSISAEFFDAGIFSQLNVLNFTRNGLTDFVIKLPPSLRVLKLSHNHLQSLSVGTLKDLPQLRTLYIDFNDLEVLTTSREKAERKSAMTEECPFTPLEHIQEVSFQGNKLTVLDPLAVRCFRNVQYLSLADNQLESLPPKIFSTFQHLQFLDLTRNHLTVLPAGIFIKLLSLKFLSLSGNHLGAVPAGLPMTEWLDLSHNTITVVPEEQKGDLYPQEVFLLGGNPLQCDCRLLWLKELFDTREYLLKFIAVDKEKFIPVCASPSHIRGDTWDVLGDESFGCKDATRKDSLESEDQEVPIVHLDDLCIKVEEVGSNYVILEWDSLNLITSARNPAELVERNKVFITFHPFGKKSEKVSVSVHLATGSYRLKALLPNTAYIVCMSVTDPASRNQHVKIQRDDCVEIVTKSDDTLGLCLKEHYIQVALVLLICLLLLIRYCCQSPRATDQKEKTS